MLYARIDSQLNIIEYPITIYQIRALYPSVSWPEQPNAAALAPYDLVEVYEVAPPTVTKHQVVTEGLPVYFSATQRWEQVWLVETISLEHGKQREKDNIKEKRYEKEVGGCTFNYQGTVVPVDSERDAQAKLSAALLMADKGLWQNGKKWKFADGIFRPLTIEQVVALAVTVGNHVNDCYQRESDLTDAVDAATTLEETNWEW